MVHGPGQVVTGSDSGTHLASPASHSMIEGSSVGPFATAHGIPRLNEETIKPAIPFGGSSPLLLTSTLIVARADANPRSVVPVRGEEINIAAHFGEGMLRSYDVYARQALNKFHLLSIGLELLIDTGVQFMDSRLQIRQMLQVHAQKEAVMLSHLALKGLYQLGNLLPQLSLGQLGSLHQGPFSQARYQGSLIYNYQPGKKPGLLSASSKKEGSRPRGGYYRHRRLNPA